MKSVYQFFFDLAGWKVVGGKPDIKKYVLILAPHTSNWDFFVGLAARSISGLQSQYLAKKSLFDIPLVGWVMCKLGGHPVDRKRKTNIVDQVVEHFNNHEEFVITITPEGTRSYNPHWKTGFYRIALKANVPIVMVTFDFENKEVRWADPVYPPQDANVKQEIENIKAHYRGVKGKYPENGIR